MLDSSPEISSNAPMPSPPSPPPPQAPDETDEPKNELSLDPNLFSKAKGSYQCKPGDAYKITATVRFNEDGNFDVVSVEPMQEVSNAEGPANDPTTLNDDEEEKALGYKRPKKPMTGPSLI